MSDQKILSRKIFLSTILLRESQTLRLSKTYHKSLDKELRINIQQKWNEKRLGMNLKEINMII